MEFGKSFFSGFDAMVFLSSGEVPVSDEVRHAIVDFVEGDKGFVGVHNAVDSFYGFPFYGKMLRGYLYSHPWKQEVQVIVRNGSHLSEAHA